MPRYNKQNMQITNVCTVKKKRKKKKETETKENKRFRKRYDPSVLINFNFNLIYYPSTNVSTNPLTRASHPYFESPATSLFD